MTFFPDSKIIVSLGGLTITWYAVFVLSAAFLCYYLSIRTLKKWGYETGIFEDFFLYMLPIAFIGARLYYVLFEWEMYAKNPIRIFYIWEGGLAIHGGLIAGTIFGIWYFRKYRVDGLRILDAIFPNLLLAQALGRWGNFMNQEAFGGIVPESYYNGWPNFLKEQMYIAGDYRQPTFLYEGIGNIIGFILITCVYKKYGRKKRGDLAFAYVTWYGLVRFFVEGLRTDSLMIGNLRIAQIISIVFMLIGILGIIGVWDKVFKNVWPFTRQKPVVVFDLDGTLVDTQDLIFESFIHTFEKYKPGYILSEEELYSFLGPTLRQTFLRYFSEDKIDEIIAYYREFNHREHDTYVKEVPHVKEVLEYLKQEQYDIAVVSNKTEYAVRLGLKRFDMEKYFDVVLGCESIENPKPEPDGLLMACEKLNRGHDDLIYIGDAPSDIKATKRIAGYSVAFIMNKNRAEEMKKEKPCSILYDMLDLISLLKEEHEWSDNSI